MAKNRFTQLLITVSVLLFTLVTLAHNLIYFRQYCYSAYDLGIYMEAVQKFGWSNWNPFLSTRGVGFLNDHWHPALMLAKIPTLIFPTSTSLFLTEIFFVVATALVPLYLVKEKLLRLDLAAIICMYLVLDQRTFEAAMAFPVHPAVWANFLLMLATAFIIRKKSEGIVIALLFAASFFGEQFAFCLLGYSLVLFFVSIRSPYRFGVLIFALLWAWFCLMGRSFLTGPILHQTDRVALDMGSFISKYSWDRAQAKNVFKFFLEFLPLLVVAVKGRRVFGFEKSTGLLIAGIFFPLILGRILSGSFGHQYDTLLVTAIGAFSLWAFSKTEKFSLSQGFLTGSLVFFCLVSFSKFEQAYGVVAEKKLQNCIHARDIAATAKVRSKDLSEAFDEAAKGNPREIFALGNLVPNLVERFPTAEVICLGMPAQVGALPDWMIIERGVCGDPWPFDQGSLESKRTNLLTQFPQLSEKKETGCIFSAHKKL
jgi:uncharacterized membrane protein